MRVRVDVTEEDIAKGTRDDCDKCPIALALSRAAGRPLGAGALGVYGPDSAGLIVRWTERLNSPQAWFICDFDEELPVKPFTFEIDLPDDEEAQP